MTFKLIKTATFLHTCPVQQIDENGKTHAGQLRVRFNRIPREQWDEMTRSQDDERLIYDVVVNKIETEIENPDGSGVMAPEEAFKAVREDLSLTGQIVDQFVEVHFGAAAKNARRSRGR